MIKMARNPRQFKELYKTTGAVPGKMRKLRGG
jgi:hypothetical protein